MPIYEDAEKTEQSDSDFKNRIRNKLFAKLQEKGLNGDELQARVEEIMRRDNFGVFVDNMDELAQKIKSISIHNRVRALTIAKRGLKQLKFKPA
jgi:hypothetical protein